MRTRSNRNGSRCSNPCPRGTFETLEARLTLAADLGFAGEFSLIGAPADNIFSSSGPYQTGGGGMVTDATGHRYVTVNGAYRTSSFGVNYSSLNVDLDPGPGVSAATMTAGLVKLDPTGGVVWTAPLAATGPGSPVVRVLSAVDADQNVYLVGDFRGTVDIDPGPDVLNITSRLGGSDYSFYMAKLNSAGQLQWARTLDAPELTPMRIDVDGAGNLIMANNFTAVPTDPPMDVDAGPGIVPIQAKGINDIAVLKYDTNGNFVWVRQFGSTGTTLQGNPSITTDGLGDVYIASGFRAGTLDLDPTAGVSLATNSDDATDGFVVRLNSNGDFVWGYATEGFGGAQFRDIEVASDGSIVVAGYLKGDVDFQPSSGTLQLTSISNGSNGLAIKLNSDSSVAWARRFGSQSAGHGETLAVDADVDSEGNVYLGGSFGRLATAGQTFDFDPGPDVYELIMPSTQETGYVLSLTESGDYRWAAALGGNTGLARVQGVSVTPDGAVQISGAFGGTGDFNPDPAIESWLSSSGSNQTVFTAKLTQSEADPNAPVVDAGPGQSVPVNGVANLHGTVTDDGLPNTVTTVWSLLSGPGAVTFGNASALDTTASFSAIGDYLLKLEATDGQFTTTDYVHIIVNPLTASLTATADAYIDNGNATTNYGASASLLVDGKPDDAALLKWNLTSIPAGSTLQSATFTINVTNASVNTYEIYELKRTWTESQTTWKKSNSSTNWQSAGAQGSLDRGSTVLGTVTASATGVRTVTLNAAGLSVVQGWINNPATNNGFIIQDYANTNTDDLAFSSKEATSAANRPQLSVVYTPPVIASLSRSGIAATAPAVASSTLRSSTETAFGALAGRVDRPIGSLSPRASAAMTGPPSTGGNVVAMRMQSGAMATIAAESAAVDSVLADFGDDGSPGWDALLDDELLLALASSPSLRVAF
ncbi:Beta-L-arabinobiosidase precursor [Lacipirellula limnantheis]|uniref:Beta-L-arabinobiosidase n=2 Tax=Lacipirellula limnantheis TaxID=2528024 RepID=A0A517TYC8_9BACT|nr:Beta-L-arabinobiosidase precursor [Lacipirellula limnantheis]